MDHDPLIDPQLEEAYAAFGQLLAAAEQPLDEQALAARIARRLNRQARRRRLQFAAAGALAMAASLVVAVTMLRVELPAEKAVEVAVVPAPAVVTDAEPIRPEPATTSAEEFEIADWDDELATETAELASAAQQTEERWRELPDGLALLKSRADTLEEEMADGSL